MNTKIPANFALEHSRLNPLEEGLKTLGVALGYKTQIVLASVSPLWRVVASKIFFRSYRTMTPLGARR
jgi:hypothetical protein